VVLTGKFSSLSAVFHSASYPPGRRIEWQRTNGSAVVLYSSPDALAVVFVLYSCVDSIETQSINLNIFNTVNRTMIMLFMLSMYNIDNSAYCTQLT